MITHLKQQDKPNVSISGLIWPIPSKMHKIYFLRTCNLAPNLSIFTYDTFLERIKLTDYHICQKIVIILRFRPLGQYQFQKHHIFCLKMEKNNFNNYLRVKLTSNHGNMDSKGLSDPYIIGKHLLLGDLGYYNVLNIQRLVEPHLRG